MLTVITSVLMSAMPDLATTEDTEDQTCGSNMMGPPCPQCPPWWRASARKGFLYQIADRVNHRAMHFLHARGRLRSHVDVNLGDLAGVAAVAACERDRAQAPRPRRLQALDDVGRQAARTDAERHVALAAERFDLPGEHPLVALVVADRRDHAGVGRQRHGRECCAIDLKATDQLRRHVLGVGGAAAVAEQ